MKSDVSEGQGAVTTEEGRVNLDTLLRRAKAKSAARGASEAKLDSLLEQHARKLRDEELKKENNSPKSDPMENIRDLFETELMPAFDDLREKYRKNDISLELDALKLLQGGREIVIDIEYGGVGMRFDGTVMTNVIAFQLTRYSTRDPAGITASGPTLRVRGLTADKFRDFICQRIAALIQAVMQRT